MNLEERLKALITWGKAIGAMLEELESKDADPESPALQVLVQARNRNPWFTDANIILALKGICYQLSEENLQQWVAKYQIPSNQDSLKIGVIMAGNIPAVGFQDALCVLITGNKLLMKNASDDKVLLPFLLEILTSIEPRFATQFEIIERLQGMDAVIATGSNNSARYFEYYFGKYPHIIRKNRNSVAILSGDESRETLNTLGEDIFSFFGLGCRNISHLVVPEGYNFSSFFEAIESYGASMMQHNRYLNNYDYHNALYLLNSEKFLTNNYLILRKSEVLSTPVSVLHYSYYKRLTEVEDFLKKHEDEIQCRTGLGGLPFGNAQCPAPWDYADNIDVVKFLLEIKAA